MPRFATINDTLHFSEKFKDIKYNLLGSTNLTVSPAGFGTYRVHISVDGHRRALMHALENGINLIDTSSNYADGAAEELTGSVLKELTTRGSVRREEIVVVSKAGYLQGQNYTLSQQLKHQGKPYPDLVEYARGLEHCIHPHFLEDQLTQSLKRLNIDAIDIYLLHNPEYYLLWAHANGIAADQAQEIFYKRIEQAFMHLEIEARNGRIRYYGISSNTFQVNPNTPGFIALDRVWQIAVSLSQDHSFRVIQFPMNLLEKGAVTEVNQPNKQTVLDFAAHNALGVLVNRPLNAYMNNQLIRLVNIEISQKSNKKELDKNLSALAEMENEFVSVILAGLHMDDNLQKELSGLFSSATYLKENYGKLGPYWAWIESQARYLTDQVSYAVQLLNEVPGKSRETVRWLDDYVARFNDTLGALTLYYGEKSAAQNNHMLKDLKKHHGPLAKCDSLQQLALCALFGTVGISCTLVGMRREEYVADVLNTLKKAAKQKIEMSFWE